MYRIDDNRYGKDWYPGSKIPEPNEKIYAIIEEDAWNRTEPVLVEASIRIVTGGNPPVIWDIKTADGTIDSTLISSSWSVIIWRYK